MGELDGWYAAVPSDQEASADGQLAPRNWILAQPDLPTEENERAATLAGA